MKFFSNISTKDNIFRQHIRMMAYVDFKLINFSLILKYKIFRGQMAVLTDFYGADARSWNQFNF